ncbi:MAG: Ig-like domain-containing protein [Actinomycetota bacterium]|nr:Ig-like domain-containing protein [Actinomycetota bacterium]
MRLLAATLVTAIILGGLGDANATGSTPPPRAALPNGQVDVVTVNAHQRSVLGIKRFIAMFQLSRALRTRPSAFNGGYRGGVAPPDIIIAEELRPSNLEIFQHLLRQRWHHKYTIAGPDDSSADILYNPDRVQLEGDVQTWHDPCLSQRTYEFAHFTELSTGLPFVIAGVHFWKRYQSSSCTTQNVHTLQAQLSQETAPTIIGGDFNRRAVQTPHECDPEETSAPLQWWANLTSPTDGGRGYVDAVATWSRQHNASMAFEWTHEQFSASEICDGSTGFRRSRIDYLFVSGAGIGDAQADAPGWAGAVPGTFSDTNYRYSDHRFVWGRFVLDGPPRPEVPSAVPERFGRVQVTWNAVDGASRYVLYRSIEGRPYDELADTDSATTSYLDFATEDGTTYRYAVAAIGSNGAQGLESPYVKATADASGPDVVSVAPFDGAIAVDPGTIIDVHVDERIAPSSIVSTSLRLFRGSHRVAGRITHPSSRELRFNPSDRLHEGTTYTVVVAGLRDELGNVGRRHVSTFTTVLPPPKHHHKHRRA